MGCFILDFNIYLKNGFKYIYLSGLITFFFGIKFLYIREKKKYLSYFSYFWLFAAAAKIFEIVYFYIDFDIILFLIALMKAFEGFYLLKAVHKYFNRDLHKNWSSFLKIIILISILGVLFENVFIILAPAIIFLSFAFIKSGKLLFDLSFNNFLTFTAVVSMLLGFNLLITPYLMNNYLNKYLIFFKALLSLLFGISIFAIYYEDLNYKLQIREEQYYKLFEQSPAGMMLIDKNNQIIKVNTSICQFTGYTKTELEGHDIFENLIPLKFKIRTQKNFKEILNGQDKEYILETYDKENNKKYFLMKATMFTQPDFSRCILTMKIDYTDYKKQNQEIEYLSYHDNLTDLYNRTFLEEEMKRLDCSRQLPIAIIMVDVNGLKLFNDTYGHQKGDQLLIKTAAILKQSTRTEDITARWAGDEFVILLPNTNQQEAAKIITRIKEICKKTDAEEIAVSLAVGKAIKENMEENIFDVLEKADQKMYQEKSKTSREAKKKIINNIMNKLKQKGCEGTEHLQRMKNLASSFADYIDLNTNEKEELILLAELHDLGKIAVDEQILQKETKLSQSEWEQIKEHSEQGYKIAAASKEFASTAKEILHHHEHWDGSGYPAQLKHEEIPYFSRIIAVIDAYDVMTHKNVYSPKMARGEALTELKNCAGSQFDPFLTKEFIKFINTKKC